MCINMPKTIKEERLRWVLPIYNKGIKLKDAAKVCPHSQRSLQRWLAAYKREQEIGLEPKSTKPKTNPRETPIRIKERIIELRNQTSKCALKLKWQLEKEGFYIHKNTVHKIIKKEGLTRKYRARKLKYKYIKVPLKQGELLEIDIKYVPNLVENRQYYQFTAIDCASRWRYLKSSEPLNPRLHDFDVLCQKLNIIHYLIDPGKPNQNGKVERNHRTDQEFFYERNKFKTFKDLQRKIKIWNKEYNNLEHCGLDGKTPNKMLQLLSINNTPNVCV